MNLILFDKSELNKKQGQKKTININLSRKDPRAIHIVKVLKTEQGGGFDAGIINGSIGKAVLEESNPEILRLNFRPLKTPAGLYPLTLIMGLSRPQTVKKVIREGTALGISRFIFSVTEKGEKTYSDSGVLKPESLRKLFIEGAQQAFCTELPEAVICDSIALAVKTAAQPASGVSLIALDNYEAVIPLSEFWKNSGASTESVVLAVGSERGWSTRERDIFRDSGYTLASLGPRVLRTETAVITGSSICLSGMGCI